MKNKLEYHLAVISHKRPENILPLKKLIGLPLTWYVNKGEGKTYLKAGAENVVECGSNICHARNKAIFDAGRTFCIQVSDDLKGIKEISMQVGKRIKCDVSFKQVAENLILQVKSKNYKFGGVAVTDNALNYDGTDYSFDKLVVNDLICISPLNYFDERMALKEDYDMCIKELIYTGGIVRVNKYLCNFPHRENKGGANTYRNNETENKATQALFQKWGSFIKPHPTRQGQVSLNYKLIRQAREEIINSKK